MSVETIDFLGHSLENPLINAAGLVNGPEIKGLLTDIERLALSAIAGVTIGSWTLEKRLGNASQFGEPTSYYDRQKQAMINALGLPNVGLNIGEKHVAKILDIAGNKPVIFSVSPAPCIETPKDSIQQSVELIDRLLQAGAPLIELNLSCPNIISDDNLPKPILGYDLEAIKKLNQALNQLADSASLSDRLGLKLPPYIKPEELQVFNEMATLIVAMPIGFLTVCNTIAGSRPLNQAGLPILSVPGGVGGLSGPATKMEGRRQLDLWRHKMPDDLPIISALGIYDGLEIVKRQSLGASLCGVNTRLYQSSNWSKTITEILVEYSQYLS